MNIIRSPNQIIKSLNIEFIKSRKETSYEKNRYRECADCKRL